MSAFVPKALKVTHSSTGLEIEFRSRLVEKLRARQADLSQQLGEGVATDFAAYRHIVGMIEGIAWAIDTGDDVVKELIGER